MATFCAWAPSSAHGLAFGTGGDGSVRAASCCAQRVFGNHAAAERRHAEKQLVEYANLLLMVVGGPSPFAGFIFHGLQERLRHLDLDLKLN